MDKRISDLYDDFVKGLIDRRTFVRKLVALAGEEKPGAVSVKGRVYELRYTGSEQA